MRSEIEMKIKKVSQGGGKGAPRIACLNFGSNEKVDGEAFMMIIDGNAKMELVNKTSDVINDGKKYFVQVGRDHVVTNSAGESEIWIV